MLGGVQEETAAPEEKQNKAKPEKRAASKPKVNVPEQNGTAKVGYQRKQYKSRGPITSLNGAAAEAKPEVRRSKRQKFH